MRLQNTIRKIATYPRPESTFSPAPSSSHPGCACDRRARRPSSPGSSTTIATTTRTNPAPNNKRDRSLRPLNCSGISRSSAATCAKAGGRGSSAEPMGCLALMPFAGFLRASSLQVALHRSLIAHRSIVGVLMKLTASAALAQQVPATVELDLDGREALVRLGRSRLLILGQERVLLL